MSWPSSDRKIAASCCSLNPNPLNLMDPIFRLLIPIWTFDFCASLYNPQAPCSTMNHHVRRKKYQKKYWYFEAHHCSIFSVAYTLNTTSSMYSVLWISAIFGWNKSPMHIYLSCQPCSLSRMGACSIQYISGTVPHEVSVISYLHLTSWRTNTGMVLLLSIFYLYLFWTESKVHWAQ